MNTPKKSPPVIVASNIISKTNMPDTIEVKPGLVLLVDKPQGWTSFDVVNKLRFTLKYKLGIKKIKVGHAGTLDPMATGLLLICVGKYTKSIEQLVLKSKAYDATLLLGSTTPSFDAESEIDATYPTDHITKELLESKLNDFRGEISQLPPMFSAIKIKGQKLYNLARKGKTIEREPRQIIIHELTLIESNLPESISIYVDCSKGTYIRSLADDIGKSLDSGAHLSALRRVSIGEYKVDHAFSLEEMVDYLEKVEATDQIEKG